MDLATIHGGFPVLNKLPKKVFLLVGIGLVIGMGVAFVLFTKVMPPAGSASAAAAPTPAPTPVPQLGPMYTFKEHLVNLADPGGRRYLRVTLYVEFEEPKANAGLTGEDLKKANDRLSAELQTRGPVIDDTLTTILASKTFGDVASPRGKDQLKQEIVAALNAALPGEHVVNVYFSDFVVQ